MFIGLPKEKSACPTGTSETPGDTVPTHLTGAESDEEKKVIALHGGWLQGQCRYQPTLLRWLPRGLKRSGFAVFYEISAAHGFAGSTAPSQLQRCAPQNRHLPTSPTNCRIPWRWRNHETPANRALRQIPAQSPFYI